MVKSRRYRAPAIAIMLCKSQDIITLSTGKVEKGENDFFTFSDQVKDDVSGGKTI